MKKNRNILQTRRGFSLVEVLAAMVIGSMVLIAVLTVYNRAERTAAAVTRSLGDSGRSREALQLIAEDFDKIIETNSDTDMIIVNRYINNYYTALLLIKVTYKDQTNKDQKYEELLWQCNKNHESDANDMVLYRSYEGIAPEDKLLDRDRETSEKNAYVPICRGVTYFEVKIITGEKDPDRAWPEGIPLGAVFIISFAEPFKDADGHYNVPESEKYSRTIAFDKSRKIKFVIAENESSEKGENTIKVNIPGNPGSPAEKQGAAK